MHSPSDLLTLTAQSLSPSDIPQDLHESLLWLLESSFMDSWSLLIILEINSRFWTGTWNSNLSQHQYHRHVCVVNKCDAPLKLHSREKRQGNHTQSHLLAESKKKRWQEPLHRPHVSRRSASTIGFAWKLDFCFSEDTYFPAWSSQSSVNFLLRWHFAPSPVHLQPRVTSLAPSASIYSEFRNLQKQPSWCLLQLSFESKTPIKKHCAMNSSSLKPMLMLPWPRKRSICQIKQ